MMTPLQLPPGPSKLPLIGNLHNLIGDAPHRALQRLALKHGPLMHLQLGELSAIVVSSPDGAREVMRTQDTNFASRPPIMAAEIISYGCTSITFGPYGDYWRQLRKICSLELLSNKRVQSFRSIREVVFSDLARWVASKEGLLVNLTQAVESSTYAVVTRAALGEKSKKQERLLVAVKEGLKLGAGFDICDLYPSIKFLPKISGMRKKLVKLHHEIDEILEEIVGEHIAANATTMTADDDNQEYSADLIDVLLKFQDDRLELPLTTDNIKAVILDVLAAGSETSSTAVGWAMTEMLKNPRILEKAQNEVRQVFDEKGVVEESSMHELNYLKSVVKETLRLHPPVPLLLPRKCCQTCKINGYEIPSNAKVIVNAWAINRDVNYWEEAECFKPERFVDSFIDYKGNNFEYIPFGAGRRICPGISFGLADVELPLAMLLYHFDWNLPSGGKREDIDMTETLGVTARRENDLFVVPVIRRPLLPHQEY